MEDRRQRTSEWPQTHYDKPTSSMNKQLAMSVKWKKITIIITGGKDSFLCLNMKWTLGCEMKHLLPALLHNITRSLLVVQRGLRASSLPENWQRLGRALHSWLRPSEETANQSFTGDSAQPWWLWQKLSDDTTKKIAMPNVDAQPMQVCTVRLPGLLASFCPWAPRPSVCPLHSLLTANGWLPIRTENPSQYGFSLPFISHYIASQPFSSHIELISTPQTHATLVSWPLCLPFLLPQILFPLTNAYLTSQTKSTSFLCAASPSHCSSVMLWHNTNHTVL